MGNRPAQQRAKRVGSEPSSKTGTRHSPAAVHPRVRGAHYIDVFEQYVDNGPSPRARSSRRGRGCSRRPRPVHPRVRGAHQADTRGRVSISGPSPRARGSRGGPRRRDADARSIPACAGLTPYSGWCIRWVSVHPRVRGAHESWDRVAWRASGPSPRARGSPWPSVASRCARRSIPTCAGLTSCNAWHDPPPQVHPRVRGAHARVVSASWWVSGPSPRARGSPRTRRTRRRSRRSIPACAGLTRRTPRSRTTRAVHPRVRGAHCGTGAGSQDHDGSIPACAGLTRARAAPIR